MNAQDFQTIYYENVGLIYRYVYNKVGHREEAEDLTSQIFVKAAHSLDVQRHPSSTRTWLFRVARTTVADYWRAYRRQPTISLDNLLDTGWEGPLEEESALANVGAAETIQSIFRVLSEREREVLTARFLLNLSVREAATKMGMTEANLKVIQFRALKHAAYVELASMQ